ncbi:molybdopterin molybdotransferase MoeA [Thermococcus thioreducens]|uniref:Molybdenum cofactor biosynthesis protein n=1 Tax=Thermococcus thioreducens TaxID=277988 RepID=A0A0Q2M367_9EURY|nr:gephyrin-like molybdotransferase Glp [Thermococcus thioreducens]ASJ12492.1 molybdopterin molybdenumtransferase MoeA [Thermococcus thioreducens]KQH82505.1 molybdenum cofactor biosynthesis protein [Thermococcus thioreducens]SEV89861.1 molybdopterin molybdochelatase [Thermococcus thioreducens]
MREFKRLTPYKEALSLLLDDLSEIDEVEEIPLKEALGRVLAEDIVSPMDSPPFDRSAVDGYALRAEDTFPAREYSPVELGVIDEIVAGEESKAKVEPGTAVKLMTGSKMPKGANAVLMQEMAERDGDIIRVLRPVAPGQNVAFKGEDVKKGEVVLRKGHILRPQDLALLKSLGFKSVKVKRKPRVGIIVTGDELIEEFDEDALKAGKIMESNSIMLMGLVRQYFGQPVFYGVVPDDEERIRNVIETAKEECDLVLVTGGSAFGDRDFAHRFVKLLFHGTTIKPGRPVGYGERAFIMSGYPAAVFTQFHLYVKHALAKLVGARNYEVKVYARLTERVPSQLGRHEFVKVWYENGEARPIKKKGSGIISPLVESNGYIVIPEDSEGYLEGETVEVVLY